VVGLCVAMCLGEDPPHKVQLNHNLHWRPPGILHPWLGMMCCCNSRVGLFAVFMIGTWRYQPVKQGAFGMCVAAVAEASKDYWVRIMLQGSDYALLL
jgi:hypothetical protein